MTNTTLKSLTGLGKYNLPPKTSWGDDPGRLRYTQVGNCCGSMVVSEFKVDQFTPNQRMALVSEVIDRIFTDLGPTCLDPEWDEDGEERYDEENDRYYMDYPDAVETIPMMPALVSVFLANRQIPEYHQALIAHGFKLMVEGATNSKSLGGVINMYVGETPTSQEYARGVGNNPSKFAKPLSGWTRVDQHDKRPA